MKAVFIYMAWLCLAAFLSCQAHSAGFAYQENPHLVTQAAEIAAAPPGTACSLKGRLIAKLPERKNRYIFEDGSGRVIVEIKKREFGDFTITPTLLVQLNGKVVSDHIYPNEIRADYLGIIGPIQTFPNAINIPD